LATAPRNSPARFAKGQVLRAQHRYAEAILEYETVIALNRNWAHAYSHLGWCRFMNGSVEALIPAQEQAIRLSPRDCSRVSTRRSSGAKRRDATPAAAIFRSFLASGYALKGDTERAAAELSEARRLVGDNRYSSIACLRAIEPWGAPKVRTLFEATYFAGLCKAGMPER